MKKILASVAALALTQFASGEMLISFSNVGPDVTMTYSGSFNLDAVVIKDGEIGGGFYGWNATTGAVGIDRQGAPQQFYDTDVDWLPFGTGNFFAWDSDSGGDVFGLFTPGKDIGFSVDYISGDPLSGTATKLNSTFKTLGLTPGTYVNTLTGPEGVTDTITVEVVPAPSAVALLGLAGLGAVRRRR